jgi:hypothetical protein
MTKKKNFKISLIILAGYLTLATTAFAIQLPDSPYPYSVTKTGSCKRDKTSICTIEIWLAHKQKKNNKAIRKELKSKSIKTLRKTIQYWKPKGGHPPTNIAIGGGISAEDARYAIDLALKLNDKIDGLIHQKLNPPNYVAIATSAWDAKSETKISPESLEKLRNPSLKSEEFHKLYRELTGEANVAPAFY